MTRQATIPVPDQIGVWDQASYTVYQLFTKFQTSRAASAAISVREILQAAPRPTIPATFSVADRRAVLLSTAVNQGPKAFPCARRVRRRLWARTFSVPTAIVDRYGHPHIQAALCRRPAPHLCEIGCPAPERYGRLRDGLQRAGHIVGRHNEISRVSGLIAFTVRRAKQYHLSAHR